jgi:hypothetical protein
MWKLRARHASKAHSHALASMTRVRYSLPTFMKPAGYLAPLLGFLYPVRSLYARAYATDRRASRPRAHGQNLSNRYRQLERSLRSKEILARNLTQTHIASTSASPDSSTECSSPISRAKSLRTFHGLIIPDKPEEPSSEGQ